MDTVYILQVVTICITALTLAINVMVTILTNKQKNYNEIITNNRIEFMLRNRDNMTGFIAEAKNIVFLLKRGDGEIDLKPLYSHFEQICIVLKTYNNIDKDIVESGKRIIGLIEQSVLNAKADEGLSEAIDGFSKLVNIYDDADWKFIKQQFNTTTKTSDDFDDICDRVKAKYKD